MTMVVSIDAKRIRRGGGEGVLHERAGKVGGVGPGVFQERNQEWIRRN